MVELSEAIYAAAWNLYAATYISISKMLESGVWKLVQKTRCCAEFHGAAHNSVRACVFRSIFQDFGKCKINCPNQPRIL